MDGWIEGAVSSSGGLSRAGLEAPAVTVHHHQSRCTYLPRCRATTYLQQSTAQQRSSANRGCGGATKRRNKRQIMEGRRPRSPKRASMSRNIHVGGLEVGGSKADVDGAATWGLAVFGVATRDSGFLPTWFSICSHWGGISNRFVSRGGFSFFCFCCFQAYW